MTETVRLPDPSWCDCDREPIRGIKAGRHLPSCRYGVVLDFLDIRDPRAESEYDADGDPIRPDPHSEDWYDGYAAGQRDSILDASSAGWARATAKGTAINVDEWGRPLYVFTDEPTPDAALDAIDLEWLPRMRLMVDSGEYVGFPTADIKRLLDIVDRLDRAARGRM